MINDNDNVTQPHAHIQLPNSKPPSPGFHNNHKNPEYKERRVIELHEERGGDTGIMYARCYLLNWLPAGRWYRQGRENSKYVGKYRQEGEAARVAGGTNTRTEV